MGKNSTSEIQFREKFLALQKRIDPKYAEVLRQFLGCYETALGSFFIQAIPAALLFLDLLEKELYTPHTFLPYHQKILSPIDYYAFSLEFIRPLVDIAHSKVLGLEHLEALLPCLEAKENIVFLANHQTESDPQAISLLLEKTHPEIGKKIIYVAGERVITDPLAIPFSMGCDLLCVYSKRYINHPPHLKAQKQLHNKHTMEKMSALMKEGGKVIYVAPSGGRDRKKADGTIEVAPFDASSIEMFDLMARKSKSKTHFLPLALATYELLPPPDTIQIAIGETRIAKKTPIFLAFGSEFSMHTLYSSNKIEQRQKRAEAVWSIVNGLHQLLQLFKQ